MTDNVTPLQSHTDWELYLRNHYLKLRNSDRFKDFSPDLQQEIIDWLEHAEKIDAQVKAQSR